MTLSNGVDGVSCGYIESFPKKQDRYSEVFPLPKTFGIRLDLLDLGIQDDEIIFLLNQLRSVTFFTRDDDFHQNRFCHSNSCIVLLDVPGSQVAELIRKFLKHKAFRTQAQRMGAVVRISRQNIHLRRIGKSVEETIHW